MSDSNQLTQQETQETQLQTHESTPKGTEQPQPGMTPEEFNRAFSAREKTLLAKIEKLSAPQKKDPEPETSTKDPLLQRIEKQERIIKEMQKRETEQALELKKNAFRSQVQKHLGDQVNSQWMDVAMDSIQRSANLTSSDAILEFDDLQYSIEDGVKHWLARDENKRFLPAKPVARPSDVLRQKREPLTQREKYVVDNSVFDDALDLLTRN